MKCTRIQEIEDSYLLGELEREEMQAVDRHLKSCTGCARRLSGYEELLGRMFASLEPVPAPTELRLDLLEGLARPGPLPLRQPSPPRREQRRWRPGAAYGLVATLLLLVSAALSLSLGLQLAENNSRQAEAQKLLELTGAPDSLVWAMLPPEVPFNPAAPRGRMYARRGGDFYLVTATNLTPPRPGYTYRAWYFRGPRPTYLGDLQPDPTGNAVLKVVNREKTEDEITSCVLTVETAGQPADGPVLPPLLQWRRPGT